MSNSRTENSTGRKKSKKEDSRILAIIVTVFVVMITGAGLGFFTASLNTKPGLTNDIRPSASSQIYDTNGHLITTVHSVENRVPVPLSKVPKDLQNAFISAEDTRFYQHMGIDPRGILRAVWANISNRGVSEGGSTITQQLAKNAYLSQERTLQRKIQEAFLALQIERQYTKNEILELYLNQIYFGQGAYGVQAAAHLYFGKNIEDLNLAECAMLAGIPKSPNYYSPLNNLKAATARQSVVLEQMVKYGYIDNEKARQAKNTKLDLSSHQATINEGGIASYFVDYVTQILIDKYGADAVYKDGLKIYTSLDLSMQRAAERAMTKLPTSRTDGNGVKQPQGALAAIDPRTGHIKAMVGGRGNDQFNRAVMAERQPGSAFKPFVYLAAIESGLTPNTVIDDTPVTFGDWSPVNYDGKLHGRVTMRTALERSLNIPTVKLAQQVGPDKALYYVQQMGISTLVLQGYTNDRNLAMSLGGLTKGVTPLETASAYGVLANHGIRVEPVAILKIVDRNGKTLEQAAPRERTAINERSAYIVTDMLRGVITSGTGAGANIGRPAAGKTGTTSDYKDAWFVGFTPDLVAAVWMGNDNEGYLNGITGGTVPANIWRAFMTDALASTPPRDFIKPAGLIIDNTPPKDLTKDETDPAKAGDDKNKEKDPDKEKDPNDKTKLPAADPEKRPAPGKNLPPPKPTKPEQPSVAPPPPAAPAEEAEKNNTN